jgi:mono/diheme cytochrome c family protein
MPDRVRRTLVACVLVLVTAMSSLAQEPAVQERSVWEGVYSQAQAQRGATIFGQACLACHASKPGEVAGHGPAPSLIGEDFTFRWTDSSIADIFDTIRQTMPEAAPNSLSAAEYAALTAYILQLNGYPSGTDEIDPAQREALQLIYIEEAPAGD